MAGAKRGASSLSSPASFPAPGSPEAMDAAYTFVLNAPAVKSGTPLARVFPDAPDLSSIVTAEDAARVAGQLRDNLNTHVFLAEGGLGEDLAAAVAIFESRARPQAVPAVFTVQPNGTAITGTPPAPVGIPGYQYLAFVLEQAARAEVAIAVPELLVDAYRIYSLVQFLADNPQILATHDTVALDATDSGNSDVSFVAIVTLGTMSGVNPWYPADPPIDRVVKPFGLS